MSNSASASIEFTLDTDANIAFPLFSAQREREWDVDWKPQFMTSDVSIIDVESVWIRTLLPTSCAVRITYQLTALSDAGRLFIERWRREFPATGEQWQAVLNHYIATGESARRMMCRPSSMRPGSFDLFYVPDNSRMSAPKPAATPSAAPIIISRCRAPLSCSL